MFRRFFDEGLAQSSYLLACSRTGRAALIDPRRDVDDYINMARGEGLTLTHAIDTHVHADFLSGSRELSALGVTAVAGPGAGLEFPHHEVRDGEVIALGDLELTCLHTPGHTPEHISIRTSTSGEPLRLFTGDTLFVGAVGRPDLLGAEVTRQLASQLHASLFEKLLALPDAVEVWPGHGAGSLCGSGIGHADHSTIGGERRRNALLQHRDRDAFVDAVLADLPETPSYFARMKRINKQGPPLLDLAGGVAAPPALSAAVAAEACDNGAWLIDLRPASEHGEAHPPRSLSIPFAPKVGYWAAWVVPPDAQIVLMTATPNQGSEVRRQLLRVGLDRVAGSIDGGFPAWAAAGLPTQRTDQISASRLRADEDARRDLAIVDVRSDGEWRRGHVDGAMHIPLPELAGRAAELPAGKTVATICEGGTRSGLAASILERAGLDRIVNVTGGMSEWRSGAGS
jgi:hydroxyacylglutathione hydrolase